MFPVLKFVAVENTSGIKDVVLHVVLMFRFIRIEGDPRPDKRGGGGDPRPDEHANVIMPKIEHVAVDILFINF